MDAVDLVDYVPQQVAIEHAVLQALEDGGDHITPVAAIGPLQCAQVSEQAGAFAAVWQDRLLLVDEGNQFIASDTPSTAAQSRQR